MIGWRHTGPLGGSIALCLLACVATTPSESVHPTEDSARQRAMVDAIGTALAGPMKARSPVDALLVDFDELYAPLSREQRAFLDAIRRMPGGDPDLSVAPREALVRVEDQRVRAPDGERTMPLQLMPRDAWEAYSALNDAMKRDLGRGVVLGSGYRSPASQLFIFVTYMPYYDYSTEKTLPHVSLPGASDHNRVDRQGVDFVSEAGVDLGYSDAPAFEALEEYRWLLEHAADFGFEGDGPGATSPWHWSFRGRR